MAASVQVLCPNGRRQNVKITPNTKLLQILEEVCQRQGYLPPQDYKLCQGRKDFDLSLSVRFSNLPNNAKLELTKSGSSRREEDVTIALQLDNGERLQESFPPSVSLWDILLKNEEKNREYKGRLTCVDSSKRPTVHPVCIFMREEVISEAALKATTLKKLGLTSGKAIIRLIHRAVEENVLQEISNKVENEKKKQAKLDEIAVEKNKIREADEAEAEQKALMAPDVDKEIAGSDEMMDVDDRDKDFSLTEQSYDGHGRQDAKEDSTNRQANADPGTTAVDLLRNFPGVQVFTPDDFSDLNPQEQEIARRLAERFLPNIQEALGSSAGTSTQEEMPFLNFKFPEDTKGLDLRQNRSQENLDDSSTPCDRNVCVYSIEENLFSTNPDAIDVSEDFFEVTQADVQYMYRDLQNQLRQYDDQPLITKSMRNAHIETMYDRYQRIIIRVQFPNKQVLQGLFRPRESIGALHNFVRENLAKKDERFYLYTTPPKKVLTDMKSSLALNQLAPAAVVHFGSDTTHQTNAVYLSSQTLKHACSRLDAEKIVIEVLPQSSPSEYQSQPTASTSASVSGEPSHRNRPSTSSSSAHASNVLPSGSVVPKWLKLSKK